MEGGKSNNPLTSGIKALSRRGGKEIVVRELVRTNDAVLVSAVGALLDGAEKKAMEGEAN